MAYNTPPTKATGDTLTAAEWNTYVRDNMAAGVPDIFEAAGDLAVAAGADQAARLPIGAQGEMLRILASGAVGWGGPIIQRFGGNATNWGTAGTTLYSPDDFELIFGCLSVGTINASSNVSRNITFTGVTFTGTPIGLCVPLSASFNQLVAVITGMTASTISYVIHNLTASQVTGVSLLWLAIGPTA